MLKNKSKSTKLVLSVCFDILGLVSFFVPLFDIIWAPISYYLMIQLYDGKKGKIAGALVFIEEILPMSDVIPTFSIMWVYTYYLDKTSKFSDDVSN